ncbi:MAG: shikimate kinase [Victivallaceae bacterium]|nr:shikimate kinase [Victivallaceae bacterium]
MNIVLTGLKHCGKSTQAALLAERLGRRAVDSDREIEHAFALSTGEELSCREIYRTRGDEFFRRLEADTIAGFAADAGGEPVVYSLGGGAVGNRFLDPAVLKKIGKVVYLNAAPLVLYSRIEAEGLPPFLAGMSDPFAGFQCICAEREAALVGAADAVFKLDMQLPARENNDNLFEFLKSEFNI